MVKVLRLAFHDCLPYPDQTGACDGCLHWAGYLTDSIFRGFQEWNFGNITLSVLIIFNLKHLIKDGHPFHQSHKVAFWLLSALGRRPQRAGTHCPGDPRSYSCLCTALDIWTRVLNSPIRCWRNCTPTLTSQLEHLHCPPL